MPSKCAAPPAPAIMTFSPLPSASAAHRLVQLLQRRDVLDEAAEDALAELIINKSYY